MKKILNGKRFDTETAIVVGSADYGYSGDFSAWKATLYKTPRSGAYFLAGEGGPMTIFARHHSDGSRSGGSNLIPLDDASALDWAEQHLTADEIEAGFAITDA